MNLGPLNLRYSNSDGYKLTVYVAFNERAYKKKIAGKTYQEQVKLGVIEMWSGTYELIPELKEACENYLDKYNPEIKATIQNVDQINLKVKVEVDPLSGVYPPRLIYLMRIFSRSKRPIPIYIKNSLIMPSHVGSGILRRFWGFFRYFKILSIGFNWSKNFPGYAVINQQKNLKSLRSIAAHEFGHLFGLDDAYDAWYRFYYPAPNTENYMMHYNKEVQPQEIAMLINAHTKNRLQFFPVKFNFKTIIGGLKKDSIFYWKKIKNIFKRT